MFPNTCIINGIGLVLDQLLCLYFTCWRCLWYKSESKNL